VTSKIYQFVAINKATRERWMDFIQNKINHKKCDQLFEMNSDTTKICVKSNSTSNIPSNPTDDSDNNFEKMDNESSFRDDDVIKLNQVNLIKATGYITVNIKESNGIKNNELKSRNCSGENKIKKKVYENNDREVAQNNNYTGIINDNNTHNINMSENNVHNLSYEEVKCMLICIYINI
jgi:hypothetical protein